MSYKINNSTEFWYGTDTREAEKVWDNSSYKGTATAFRFVYAGGTSKTPDNQDQENVVGFKNLGPNYAARARTWVTQSGNPREIREADMMINSLSWINIQPHDNTGPNDYCVRNALVHEFGHWLGLSHMEKNKTVGNWIEYIPDTMYYDIDPGEHKKETLECDDK